MVALRNTIHNLETCVLYSDKPNVFYMHCSAEQTITTANLLTSVDGTVLKYSYLIQEKTLEQPRVPYKTKGIQRIFHEYG